MKLEMFKAGHLQQRYQYKSFEPVLVNQVWTWDDPVINILLEKATRALGELNAFSLIVPDIDLFIQMHVAKEAQKSSLIEGTQTGIDEALMAEEQIKPEKRDDWREVRNYIEAVNTAISELERLPLSNRLLKDTHAILLKGTRGKHKQPGEFRTSQNWIGGSNLMDAVFIPPHQDGLGVLLSDLEQFWHNDEIFVPHLIRAAISHYQFETIHPFSDGNGRIGRLLIPLYLVAHGVLEKPSLYLSDYFERHRASYYDALMRVRTSNDLIHWVKFFLNGVEETANKGKTIFTHVLILRTEVEEKILTLGTKAQNARLLLNLLYKNPLITVSEITQHLNISRPTASALIRDFQRLEILVEYTGQIRGKLYVFKRYFDLFMN
jgi:Fic family protein